LQESSFLDFIRLLLLGLLLLFDRLFANKLVYQVRTSRFKIETRLVHPGVGFDLLHGRPFFGVVLEETQN